MLINPIVTHLIFWVVLIKQARVEVPPNFYSDGHSKEVTWWLPLPLLPNFKPLRLEILVLFTDCMG